MNKNHKRLEIVGAATTAAVLLLSGVANADSFNYNLNWSGYTWSNCKIQVGFV